MKCDDCKFADWKKTSNGRLHPSKEGRCVFEWIPPPLPAAFFFHYALTAGGHPLPSGGFIERGRELMRDCPTKSKD